MTLREARPRNALRVSSLPPLVVVYFSFSLSLFVLNVVFQVWPFRLLTAMVSHAVLNENKLSQKYGAQDANFPTDWEQFPKLYVKEPQPLRAAQTPSVPFDIATIEKAAPFSGVVNDPQHICQTFLDSVANADSRAVTVDSLPPACAYIAHGAGENEVPSSTVAGHPTPVAEGRLTFS